LAAILDFSPTINYFQKKIFLNKNQFTELKNLYSLIFAKILKMKVKHPASCCHFEKNSKTVFYKILGLLSTTEHGRGF
jgi:hypothetical protein